MLSVLIVLLKACPITPVKLDLIECGVDKSTDVSEGDIRISEFPWLGILYYPYWGINGETRAVTTVTLIQREFVIGAAAEIGPMPKENFRRKTRVLLGEEWDRPGRRVRSYVLHPEYGETYNTIALVQLKDIVRDSTIRPPCPPPDTILKNPTFYVIKFKENFHSLAKEVIRVMHIPGPMCKDFYVAANLYNAMMRPPHVACVVSLLTNEVCVWNAGAALVVRDVWGRWQLLGVGVRGPGCGAPSRYLDIMSYMPWIEQTLDQFQRFTITKINNHQYVLRSGSTSNQRFGACDEEEKVNMIYRDQVQLRTDNNQYQYLTYNLTLYDNVEYTCLTLTLINASATSEMRVRHHCDRRAGGAACYQHRYSSFDISVKLMFSDSCLFELVAWGHHKNMKTLDVQQWKWNEGSYYEDFALTRVEYRGQSYMTEFGYEPLDTAMWVQEFDIWTTTENDNTTTSTGPPYYLPDFVKRRTTTVAVKAHGKKKPLMKIISNRFQDQPMS